MMGEVRAMINTTKTLQFNGGLSMGKVVLITGASAGVGSFAAKELAKAGHRVYAGARRLDKMSELETLGVSIHKMDVTSEEEVGAVVGEIIKNEGRIDVLINNAGYGGYGMVEAVSLQEAQRQFDANVFGLARVTKAVLPHMRRQRSGTIINMSSLVGRVSSPMIGWYGASKHAVEALSGALRAEVKGYGINVVLVEPGAVVTEFLEVALQQIKTVEHPEDYKENVKNFVEGFRRSYKNAPGPHKVSRVILKAINSDNPRARYAVGRDCKMALFMNAILPTKAMDSLMRKVFNVTNP